MFYVLSDITLINNLFVRCSCCLIFFYTVDVYLVMSILGNNEEQLGVKINLYQSTLYNLYVLNNPEN